MSEELKREDLFIRVDDIEPAKWIVEGLAMEQGLTIIFGDKGAGKTTLSMQLLDAMLANKKLFGLDVEPVDAFIIEHDEPPRVFRNHRDRILAELPLLKDMEIPKVFVTWRQSNQDFTNLVDLIRAYPAKLVIIDSFTSLGIPDLNHPNTSTLLDRLRQINVEEDCSIILLHHYNRKGQILGSVTLEIKADNIVELNSDGLKFHKTRGELTNVWGNTLPIKRSNGSILFKLPLAQRAKMLKGKPEAMDILAEEYPDSSRESRRVTLSKAKKKAKEFVMVTPKQPHRN